MMGGGMSGLGLGFGFLGWVFMVFFWVGLIALAIWIVKTIFSGDRQSSSGPSRPPANAREILDRRYARGEINREEYETIRNDLQ